MSCNIKRTLFNKNMQKIKFAFYEIKNSIDLHYSPNLGISYCKEYLDKKLPNIFEFYYLTSYQELYDTKPEILAISCYSQDYEELVELTNFAKSIGIKFIIVGGYHITAYPSFLPIHADVGIIGEGEITLYEVIKSYLNNSFDKDKFSIKGICFRRSQREKSAVKSSERREEIKDLDELPFPDWTFGLRKGQSAYIITGRGCPYRCYFCASSSYWEKVRYHSAKRVAEEIKLYHKLFPERKLIPIWDDIFAINKERIEEIIKYLEKYDLLGKVEFSCQVRANLVDDELAYLLKKLGVKEVSFGAESADERILSLLKPKVTVEDNQRALDILYKHKIIAKCSFIVGTFSETEKEVKKLFEFLYRNYKKGKIHSHEITILTPMPRTEFWKWFLDFTNYRFHSIDWHKLRFFTVKNNNLKSIDELLEVRLRNKSFYFNEYFLPQKRLFKLLKAYNTPLLEKKIPADLPELKDNEKSYFGNIRPEILNLIPFYVEKILDVGCGYGYLAHHFKRCVNPFASTYGIEINKEIARKAEEHLDKVYNIDLNDDFTLDLSYNYLDAIICADVLEHLDDPFKTLERLLKYLKPGGFLIVSIPNISHYSIIRDLLRNKWEYREEGLLDKTHKYFFTDKNFEEKIKNFPLKLIYKKARKLGKCPEEIKKIASDSKHLENYQYYYVFQYLGDKENSIENKLVFYNPSISLVVLAEDSENLRLPKENLHYFKEKIILTNKDIVPPEDWKVIKTSPHIRGVKVSTDYAFIIREGIEIKDFEYWNYLKKIINRRKYAIIPHISIRDSERYVINNFFLMGYKHIFYPIEKFRNINQRVNSFFDIALICHRSIVDEMRNFKENLSIIKNKKIYYLPLIKLSLEKLSRYVEESNREEKFFKYVRCPLCGWQGLCFDDMVNPATGQRRKNAKCPNCFSLERHRAFILFLKEKFKLDNSKIFLEFGPVKEIAEFIKKQNLIYFSADLFAKADVKCDIQNLPFKENSIDYVLCFHVLEHIFDDLKALIEIINSIKPDGRIFVAIPLNKKLDFTIEYIKPDPNCHNHWREYGLDFEEKLKILKIPYEKISFTKYFSSEKASIYGFSNLNDDRFILQKPQNLDKKELLQLAQKYWQNKCYLSIIADNYLMVKTFTQKLLNYPHFYDANFWKKLINYLSKYEKESDLIKMLEKILEKSSYEEYENFYEIYKSIKTKLITKKIKISELIEKAEHLYEEGKISESLKILQEVLKKEPQNTIALNDIAAILINEGDFAQAEKILHYILNIEPANSMAKENLKILEKLKNNL